MKKINWSVRNVGNIFTKANMKTAGWMIGGAFLGEITGTIVQALGGKDSQGNPRIPMANALGDLVSGLVPAVIFAGFKRNDAVAGIVITKAIKRVYIHLNPHIANIVGTPLLPASKGNTIKIDENGKPIDGTKKLQEFDAYGNPVNDDYSQFAVRPDGSIMRLSEAIPDNSLPVSNANLLPAATPVNDYIDALPVNDYVSSLQDYTETLEDYTDTLQDTRELDEDELLELMAG